MIQETCCTNIKQKKNNKAHVEVWKYLLLNVNLKIKNSNDKQYINYRTSGLASK